MYYGLESVVLNVHKGITYFSVILRERKLKAITGSDYIPLLNTCPRAQTSADGELSPMKNISTRDVVHVYQV